jgi:phage gp36-like protein
MTNYVSKELIVSLYGTDDVEDVTDDRMELIVSQTQELVDSYLAARYTTPLDPVPKLIEMVAVDLARWAIIADGRLYDETRFDGLKTRYENAITLLETIRTGVLNLGVVGTTPQNIIQVRTPPRTFTDSINGGFY